MIEEGRFHSIRQQDDTHRDPDVEVSHHSKLLLGHGRRVQRHEQEMQQSTQNTWQPVQCRLTGQLFEHLHDCLLYTSPSPRDGLLSRMPSSA